LISYRAAPEVTGQMIAHLTILGLGIKIIDAAARSQQRQRQR
jgi:hypothetical protein